jgi:3-hydroxymyristoyl/3-hydroxydecanoyl-(acyl carrier protein) dehydratase
MLPLSAKSLLPQQPPFQMVDTLVQAEEGFYATTFTVMSQNVMCTKGYFTEGGLIENMAQTAACGTGYVHSSQGKPVPVGYIGAIKHVHIKRNPHEGESLSTEVRILNQIGGASIAKAEVHCEEELIASCELTIFIQT